MNDYMSTPFMIFEVKIIGNILQCLHHHPGPDYDFVEPWPTDNVNLLESSDNKQKHEWIQFRI